METKTEQGAQPMSETKPAVNVYGVIDNELQRLHDLLRLEMSIQRSDSREFQRFSASPSTPQVIRQRIWEFQDVIITAMKEHDKVVQEKVAELALTGNSGE